MNLETRTHQCLATDSPAYGGWCILNSPLALEIMASRLDLDFMAIEMQHAAIGIGDAIHLLRALQATNPEMTPFARVPTQDRYWIEQCLDAGFVGLIVPMVETAEQAEMLAQAAHYPPAGARSRGVTVRAGLYENYFEQINRQLILVPQIETARGLHHCEEIVEVAGVAGVLLGPGDLSLSCGWKMEGIWSNPAFVESAQRVVSACKETGKFAATLTASPDDARRARDLGFQLIALASDGVDMRVEMVPRIQRSLSILRQKPRENDKISLTAAQTSGIYTK